MQRTVIENCQRNVNKTKRFALYLSFHAKGLIKLAAPVTKPEASLNL